MDVTGGLPKSITRLGTHQPALDCEPHGLARYGNETGFPGDLPVKVTSVERYEEQDPCHRSEGDVKLSAGLVGRHIHGS